MRLVIWDNVSLSLNIILYCRNEIKGKRLLFLLHHKKPLQWHRSLLLSEISSIYPYMYVYVYVCVCIYIYMCVYVYIYVYAWFIMKCIKWELNDYVSYNVLNCIYEIDKYDFAGFNQLGN